MVFDLKKQAGITLARCAITMMTLEAICGRLNKVREPKMIDLYTWTTPNGRKASIMLEELGLAYDVHPVDISAGEQFELAFLKISPNNKIPAIVDRDKNLSVFESGAILIYLAEKTASPLLPASAKERAKTLEWLMFQMGSIGPMFGQHFHFSSRPTENTPYAIKRYRDESKRILNVMEKRLGDVPYLAGDYSIADIAAYPWVNSVAPRMNVFGFEPAETQNVSKWLSRIGERDAVKRGMDVPAPVR